jgi:hypothetical protein
MPYWLSHGIVPRVQEPVSKALTEEQFATLPDFLFVPSGKSKQNTGVVHSDHDDDEEEDGDDDAASEQSIDPELGDRVLPPSGSSRPPPTTVQGENVVNQDIQSFAGAKKAEATVAALPESAPTASCRSAFPIPGPCRWSECSICIDDFQVGELLTLLPRCQHAFHKDCIKPWLLERQGRCPTCKADVLVDGQHTFCSDTSSSTSEVYTS